MKMNTKKSKNKKSNKSPNLNPPQVVQNVKVPEKVDDIPKVESELQIEERVPEIISEVIPPPAEVKEVEVETPQKPKRNRGKKKKHDKDETEDQDSIEPTLEDTKDIKDSIEIKESIVTNILASDTTKVPLIDTKVEKTETVQSPLSDVTPTARKKKNKNKKNANQEQIVQEKDKIEKGDVVEETLLIETENIAAEQPDLSPQVVENVKSTKKKNKKKKRNDSEKSDKTEEISCTTAFEKLLIVEVEKVEDTKKEKKGTVESNVTVEDDLHKKQTIEEKTDETKLEEKITKTEDDIPKGSKNKKKNKKAKSDALKTDLGQEPVPSESKCEKVFEEKSFEKLNIEATAQDVVPEIIDDSKDVPGIIAIETTSLIEESAVKPKAKIAKPVDKKRKEKSEHPPKDINIDESEISRLDEIKSETGKVDTVLEVVESALKEEMKSDREALPEKTKDNIILGESINILSGIEKNEEITSKDIPLQEKSKDDVILSTLVELINAPSGMGKKRKKSPKPPKDKPKDVLSEENRPSVSQGELKESIEPVKQSDCESKIEEKTVTQDEAIAIEPVKVDPEIKELVEQPSELKTEVLPLKVDIETIKDTLNVSETKKDAFTTKSGKKRKKSPKPPTKLETIKPEPETKFEKFETTEIGKELEQEVTQTKHTIDIESQQHKEEKTAEFCDFPDMEDIEIRSMKTDETEDQTLEATPDNIQYPRPISQQQIDDNNNTIIQEIAVSDDVKLEIPIVIPDTSFIRDDIPLTSPELVASGIKIIDVPNITKSSEPEKTDLKSKMMEVNQDMEELRLSIERSLAELTSMEKSEEKVEKQFEEQTLIKAEESKAAAASETDKASVIDATILESQDKQPQATVVQAEVQQLPFPGIAIPMPPPAPLFTDIKKLEVEAKSSEEIKTEVMTSEMIPPPPPMPKTDVKKEEQTTTRTEDNKPAESTIIADVPPVCPARKDNKGKGKSKKKGKQETGHIVPQTQTETTSTVTQQSSQEAKKAEKSEQKTESAKEKTKQQSFLTEDPNNDNNEATSQDKEKSERLPDFEPIENFEDAMTSSIDDVNKTFEMIANEAQSTASHVNPEINITAPVEDRKKDKKDEKTNPVTQPKNLLGHPDIPVRSNKMDYKKEKNKPPNAILAKVKIKDSIQIETSKQSKESQTDNIKKLMKKQSIDESFSKLNENEEYVYKYSFRKVFLPNVCHVCKKELKQSRVTCSYCNLLFYCSTKHKDEDWPQHQALCFAVSTIVHLKEQKHIYEDAKNITGHNYRLLRMQMIVSCEKVLKRKLVPWEQEALLYPRICADAGCREWRQSKLADCECCGQISFCAGHPDHFPKSHQRWCKSYSLYQKLVCYQQTKGRLEPKLPGRVMMDQYQLPEKINEVLASMYTEKIDMNDVEYAALTQLATAPLTAVYSFQIYTNNINSIYANGTLKKTSFTIHVVGAELHYEADALSKWEVFFLHLRPDVKELNISLIAPDLNPHNLPLDLLGKVKLCESCHRDKRRVLFSFQDNKTYTEYYRSDDFTTPDLVCAFNPSIQRSSVYNGKDTWPTTINCILKQKIPFIITSHTMEELGRDLGRIKECSDLEFNMISQPKHNSFASVRPDRNFISDDEMPLLFKNYCFAVISGLF